jgi:hypothetical protein
VSISRRHLLAKLGLALPAAAALVIASGGEARATSGSQHRKRNPKTASGKHNRRTAQNQHRHATPTS